MFATRTSRARLGLVAAGLLLAAAHADAAGIKFRSADDALDQGLSAYNGGYYELAIPALEFAAASNHFLAQYYLALIFADNATAHTDHAKAYILFQRIANEHAEADPEDDQRAKYVAKALTVLAGYLQRGLPEIGLKADAHRAAEYLNHAAVFFNHPDAQFELAKLHLASDENASDIAQAKHWLSRLSQSGHAGAQAFLADLLWRGKFMERDGVRALALIAVAVENAPPADRVDPRLDRGHLSERLLRRVLEHAHAGDGARRRLARPLRQEAGHPRPLGARRALGGGDAHLPGRRAGGAVQVGDAGGGREQGLGQDRRTGHRGRRARGRSRGRARRDPVGALRGSPPVYRTRCFKLNRFRGCGICRLFAAHPSRQAA